MHATHVSRAGGGVRWGTRGRTRRRKRATPNSARSALLSNNPVKIAEAMWPNAICTGANGVAGCTGWAACAPES
ncbi:hypothetical protein GCM10027174_11790 [Salinifilum aidingensis]